MVITSTLSHGNDAALVSASPVEDEAVEPPICGYSSSSEKPKDESVTYIEERTDDEITEYAHTSDAAFIARHLRVDLKLALLFRRTGPPLCTNINTGMVSATMKQPLAWPQTALIA